MPDLSKPIVALAGYAGAGKDAVADVLCDEYGFARVAFADPLREMAAALNPILEQDRQENGWFHTVRYNEAVARFGYTDAKRRYAEMRTFLQRLGTEAGRKVLGENVWVDAALLAADELLARPDVAGVVFTDCRFPNEAAATRERGGTVALVTRPGVGPLNDHASEAFAGSGDYDTLIENDGTLADLALRVDGLIADPFD